jgi:hypothetical protein
MRSAERSRGYLLGSEVLDVRVVVSPDQVDALHLVEEGSEESRDLPFLLETCDRDPVLQVSEDDDPVRPMLLNQIYELPEEAIRLVRDTDSHLREFILDAKVKVRS